jgi:hypothetical protein
MKLALENAPRGRAAQAFAGFIDLGQQPDVGPGVALRKSMTAPGWFRTCPVAI